MSKSKISGSSDDKDHHAYTKLFQEYYASLCSYAETFVANKEDAKEIVVDVFENFWKKNRVKLNDGFNIEALLFVSTKNMSIDYLRKNKRIVQKHSDFASQFPKDEDNPEIRMIHAGTMKLIWEEIDKFPEKRRQVFILKYRHELSNREIADHLNISYSTVTTHIDNGIKTLRDVLPPDLPLLLLLVLLNNFSIN